MFVPVHACMHYALHTQHVCACDSMLICAQSCSAPHLSGAASTVLKWLPRYARHAALLDNPSPAACCRSRAPRAATQPACALPTSAAPTIRSSSSLSGSCVSEGWRWWCWVKGSALERNEPGTNTEMLCGRCMSGQTTYAYPICKGCL